jgi:tripartite-type tricarboxylate transporter receptor subunit TctC
MIFSENRCSFPDRAVALFRRQIQDVTVPKAIRRVTGDMRRRQFLGLIGAAAGLSSAAPGFAQVLAQSTYPSRPVRIVVGFAAGGGVDISARLIGQWLSERLGQPFVIENRTGADGNIATEAVVDAPADGYTLLLATLPNAVNATLYPSLKCVFLRDMTPVAGIIRVPMVVLVHPSLPVKDISSLIAYAKANPGALNMASAGNGSAPHMAGELFNMMAAVKMTHIAYRGQGPALSDLIGGQVQILFAAAPGTADFIRAGSLCALAVTASSHAEVLKELPTVGSSLPGYEASQWYGIAAPAKTPADIVERLNTEINAAFDDAAMKTRFAAIAGEMMPGSPADFGRLISAETEKWAGVVKSAGLKVE